MKKKVRPVSRKKYVRCLGPCREHWFWSLDGGRICRDGRIKIREMRMSPRYDSVVHDPRV